MIAGGLVSWAAAQHGDRPSLVFGDRVLSHTDVERLSNRWAQALLALGLAPGERVAVLLDNSVHSVASVFGVEKAALTYVALNARHTLAEQLDVLADADPAAVIVGPAFASLALAFADPATTGLPGLRHVLGLGLTGLPATTAVQSLDALVAAAPCRPSNAVTRPKPWP